MDGGIKLQRGNLLFSFSMNYAKKRQPYSMWLFSSPYSYERFRTFDGSGPGYSRWSAREQAVYSRTCSGSLSIPHFIPIGIKTYIMKPREILYETILFFLTMIISLLFIRLAEHFNTSVGWIFNVGFNGACKLCL